MRAKITLEKDEISKAITKYLQSTLTASVVESLEYEGVYSSLRVTIQIAEAAILPSVASKVEDEDEDDGFLL